jgi:hypothetical protein
VAELFLVVRDRRPKITNFFAAKKCLQKLQFFLRQKGKKMPPKITIFFAAKKCLQKLHIIFYDFPAQISLSYPKAI